MPSGCSLARFESLQAYYTVAGRDLERELIPMLRSEGVGLMVWSPLAGGLLSGKYGRDQQGEAGSRRIDLRLPAGEPRAGAMTASTSCAPIAQAHGVSVAQVALAWLLHQPQVTSVIVGAKRPEQLADNLAATQADAECRTSLQQHRRGQPPAGRIPGLDVRTPGWCAAKANRRSQALTRITTARAFKGHAAAPR